MSTALAMGALVGCTPTQEPSAPLGDPPRTTAAASIATANVERLGLRLQLGSSRGDRVIVRWSFPGEVAMARADLPLVRTPAGLTPREETAGRLPLWLVAPMRSATRPGVLVVTPLDADSKAWAEAAEAARTRIAARVRLPRAPLVVEVAADVESLARALDQDPVATQVGGGVLPAAVTTSPDGRAGVQVPLHVFVDATQVSADSGIAAEVLLAHEFVHVATRSPVRRGIPLWWQEGYADYVAFAAGGVPAVVRDMGLVAAGPARSEQQGLPSPTDFEQRAEWAYPAARWVVAVLVERAGLRRDDPATWQRLSAFDDRLSGGQPLEEALDAEFGVGMDELTRAWLRRLEHLRS
ncbi:MAG: hypothetical protein WAW88_14550 [Nocardioides sp.]